MNKPPFNKPPFAKDVQIKTTAKGRLSVRCRHGWEQTDETWFALKLWAAAHNKEGVK